MPRDIADFVAGLVLGSISAGLLGLAIGHANGRVDMQRDAVKHNMAEYVANQYGAPQFRWRISVMPENQPNCQEVILLPKQ